jgi:hypothetical protein
MEPNEKLKLMELAVSILNTNIENKIFDCPNNNLELAKIHSEYLNIIRNEIGIIYERAL